MLRSELDWMIGSAMPAACVEQEGLALTRVGLNLTSSAAIRSAREMLSAP